jgi:hypothetical protein
MEQAPRSAGKLKAILDRSRMEAIKRETYALKPAIY